MFKAFKRQTPEEHRLCTFWPTFTRCSWVSKVHITELDLNWRRSHSKRSFRSQQGLKVFWTGEGVGGWSSIALHKCSFERQRRYSNIAINLSNQQSLLGLLECCTHKLQFVSRVVRSGISAVYEESSSAHTRNEELWTVVVVAGGWWTAAAVLFSAVADDGLLQRNTYLAQYPFYYEAV